MADVDIKGIAVEKGANIVEIIVYAAVGVAAFTAVVGGTIMQLVGMI